MRGKINGLFSQTNAKTIMVRNLHSSVDPNFQYFSGLDPEIFPGDFIILHPGKKPLLVASHFEAKNARAPGLSVKSFATGEQLEKILKKEMYGKKIGLNFEVYPVNPLKRLKKLLKGKKFFDASGRLGRARAIKTQKEIKKIKNAVRISEEALERFPEIIKKFKAENDIAAALDNEMKRNGADALAFPTIVAAGANAAIIHHEPARKKIKKGELLLVDFGAKADFYCADLTRMFSVGKPGEKQKRLFDMLLEARKTMEGGIRPGASAKKIFEKTEEFLKERGFAAEHGFGHGLGIETHDYPQGFTQKSRTRLEENMVFTVEPGIYGKNFGLRLEDDIAITAEGFRFLSKPQKELQQI